MAKTQRMDLNSERSGVFGGLRKLNERVEVTKITLIVNEFADLPVELAGVEVFVFDVGFVEWSTRGINCEVASFYWLYLNSRRVQVKTTTSILLRCAHFSVVSHEAIVVLAFPNFLQLYYFFLGQWYSNSNQLCDYLQVSSYICHCTESVWHIHLFFFIPLFSLRSLSSSPSSAHRLHLFSHISLSSYLFLLLLQLTAPISTLSHIFFFFSFSSPPLSPLSHISLSSSLSPPIRSILSVQCTDAAVSLFHFSPSRRFPLFYLSVAESPFSDRRFTGKEDCIGALDGTHVRVKESNEDAPRYRGRKRYPIQNMLTACSFDLKFTYILPSWEGTASNSRITKSALTKNDNMTIPKVDKEVLHSHHGRTAPTPREDDENARQGDIIRDFIALVM
ncbi:uncharacterized protein LOC112033685 [Quercus suber]|uniref:uncharacterized protein LOC112033685 n=1 Tax=Quercus suber TaxID=58331 RepID=UPI0032E057A4